MELKLYDTLTKEKRVFTPLDPANVRMYVCGPTVYDFAHIGNARPVIVFDVLFRLLRHIYGEKNVTYVRNITDVDDKINNRAARDFPELPLNDAIRKVTEKTANQFHADAAALGCLPPTHQPRATDFVLPRADGKESMKGMIQTLLDKENAYFAKGAEGKEILFDVTSMSDYGALSGRKLEDQKAGARVAVDAHKRNPADFVLWKESGAREPRWGGEFLPNPKGGYPAEFELSPKNASEEGLNSPFISIHGRPGWHIECSAMSAAYLGDVFDIHGGGLDLIFPHHENEIAQSRCAHGAPAMANYWMHNGFVQVEGEKMSKSLGNFFTINELLEDWPGDVLRLQMLLTNYRSPINWTENNRLLAQSELEEWAESLHSYFNFPNDELPSEVVEALCDDLNTSAAITALRELHVAVKKGGHKEMQKFAANLKFLGFQKLDKPGLFRTGVSGLNVSDVAIGKYEPAIRKLRAATANGAPIEILSSISSALIADGLGIDERKSGDMILVRGSVDETESLIQALVANRLAARARKDFAESDRIRDELAARGIVLKDGKDVDGKPVTTWEIAR